MSSNKSLKILTKIESILSDSNGQPIEHDSSGGTVEISGEEPPPEAPEAPTGLVATDGDSQVVVSWNPSFGADEYLLYREDQGNNGGGDGGGNGGGDSDIGTECDTTYGTAGVYDCEMQCVDAATAESWIGDGFCDDGTWGMYLYCEEFSFDGGDCGDGGGGSEDCASCEMDFTA